MSGYIYILDKNGHPLMPTKRRRHIQKLLNKGLARIAEHVPYTVQLKYDSPCITQPLIEGIDAGRTNIGVSVVNDAMDELISVLCITRNKEIRSLMAGRKMYRMARRRGVRERKKRRAKKFGTMLKAGLIMRRLPKCEADIICKVITNKEARFCNRHRGKKWLTATVSHLVGTHISLHEKICKYLPVTDVAIEINRFAFMLLEDPKTSGIDFQNGRLKGYDSVKDFIPAYARYSIDGVF